VGGASGATPRCNAQALNAVGYARSIGLVRVLPELVAWSRTQPFPVAYGQSLDQQLVLDGTCYWSVSVYADRPERLELWNVFYVEDKGKRILVLDPLSGEAITLQAWRARGKNVVRT
jgi:hypothetical protein